jgi:hypothetical protein
MNGFVGAASGQYQQFWPVQNVSGEEIPPFACMRIVGTSVLIGGGSVGFYVDKPNEFGAQHRHIFNSGRPIQYTGSWWLDRGEAVIGPILTAVYESGDGIPSFGQHWGPRSGSWKLRKSTGGFMIADNGYATSSDDTNAIVRVVPAPMLSITGKTDASIFKGTPGDVSIYWSDTGSALTDTGVNVLAYNRCETVSSGKWVHLSYRPWYDSSAAQWEIVTIEP